jgi:hypothetical protein
MRKQGAAAEGKALQRGSRANFPSRGYQSPLCLSAGLAAGTTSPSSLVRFRFTSARRLPTSSRDLLLDVIDYHVAILAERLADGLDHERMLGRDGRVPIVARAL